MTEKVSLGFTEIVRRLRACSLPDVDCVVGIASGGVVPASLAAYQLERPLYTLHITFREPGTNRPLHDAPQVLKAPALGTVGQHVLLVDDVAVTGKTLEAAKEVLAGHHITTLVMKGEADCVLFPDVQSCVRWPWA